VQNKRDLSLNGCEQNVMRVREGRLQWMSKQRAEYCFSRRILCAFNFKYHCVTSHSFLSISLYHKNIQKSHNCFAERWMSYVITVHAVVKNVMLFSLYKVFVRRFCCTNMNYSQKLPKHSGKPQNWLWLLRVKSVIKISARENFSEEIS